MVLKLGEITVYYAVLHRMFEMKMKWKQNVWNRIFVSQKRDRKRKKKKS